MYKHLYDKFSHWYRGGTIYFYSDPHFNDPEMVYLRKNYIGDEEQVKAINRKIGKNDTIVILGDIGDVKWVKKIRGYKVLVMGNHDKGASNYKRIKSIKYFSPNIVNDSEEDAMLKQALAVGYKYKGIEINEFGQGYAKYEYDNNLFDEVYEGPVFISDKILLSHEPIYLPFAYNIHGHDHSGWYQAWPGINVCAELINYTPISIKEIVETGALGKITDIHRTTIDGAIDRKKKKEGKK